MIPRLLGRIRALVEAGRWEPVGGWWVEADLFGASPESIRRQAELAQRAVRGADRPALHDRFLARHVRPSRLAAGRAARGRPRHLRDHPAVGCRVGLAAGVRLGGVRRARGCVVARPAQYAGEPVATRRACACTASAITAAVRRVRTCAVADAICATVPAVTGRSRRGPRPSTRTTSPSCAATSCITHVAATRRWCRSRNACAASSAASLQTGAPIERGSRCSSGSSTTCWPARAIEEVYDEAVIDLAMVEQHSRHRSRARRGADVHRPAPRRRRPPGARPRDARVHRGTVGSRSPGPLTPGIGHRGRRARRVLRRVEQYGAAWRLHALVHLDLAPDEERELHWSTRRGGPPAARRRRGMRVAVVADGTDTWGHSLVRYGPEVDAVAPARSLQLRRARRPRRGPGRLDERDRALKLAIPFELLDPELPPPVAVAPTARCPAATGTGPLWGRVWSYDVDVGDALRITLRRSPPYALHDPLERVDGIDFAYTDQDPFTARFRLQLDQPRAATRGHALIGCGPTVTASPTCTTPGRLDDRVHTRGVAQTQARDIDAVVPGKRLQHAAVARQRGFASVVITQRGAPISTDVVSTAPNPSDLPTHSFSTKPDGPSVATTTFGRNRCTSNPEPVPVQPAASVAFVRTWIGRAASKNVSGARSAESLDGLRAAAARGATVSSSSQYAE